MRYLGRTTLGDAENPAHTEWQKHSPKFRDQYVHGPSTLSFVRKSLREISLFLSRPPQGIDRDLLKDVFYIERTAGESGSLPGRGHNESGKDRTQGPEVPSVTNQGILRISQSRGGVRVTLSSGAEVLPEEMSLLFAYGIRRGNPFRRYHRLDFDLGSDLIHVDSKNIEIILKDGNRIEFRPISADFELTVSGFDSSRDLVVRSENRGEVL